MLLDMFPSWPDPGTKAEPPLPPCSRGSMVQCLAWQGLGFCLRAYGKLWAQCSKRYQPLPLSSRTGSTFPFSATKTSSCVDHTCTIMNQKSYVLLVSFDPQDIPITSKFFLGTSSETLRKNSPAQPQSKTAFRKNSSSIRENFVKQLTSNKPQRLRKLDIF